MKRLPFRTILPLALLAVTNTALAAGVFVAPGGSDTNPGTVEKPLATIQAGVNRLRPGDTLLVRGGTFRETVVFPNSGTAEMPIIVRPYQNEKVIVSGCDSVSGWTKHDAAKNVWKTPMNWTLGTGRNQIFRDGAVMIEARHPNTPAAGLEMYVADLSPLWPTFGEFSIPEETRVTQPGRIVSPLLEGQADDYWKGGLYYGVHYEGWCAQTGVIESSTSGQINVGDRTNGWWFGSAYGGTYPKDHEEGRGMIVGHANALDQPGEWHWQDNVLYVIPPEGVDLATATIEAKRRQLAFDLSGREHIRLVGLNIQATSLRLQDSAHCVVDDCHLSCISHYTRQYGIGQIEHGRNTIKSGETGVFVGGHDNSFLNCSLYASAGAGFHLRGYHHTIHNCLIDEVGYTAHYVNAITDAVGDFSDYENMLVGGHVITQNTMRNAGRHFFNFYGNGTSTASRNREPMDYMATLFAHNHIYNGMLQTRDAGLITGYYSSGGTLNGLNSQVVYNVLHDSYDTAAMRWGLLGIIYLDAGTCDVDLHHNLLWAAPGSLQRGLWYNTACVDIREHDNIFHPGFTRTCAELTPADFPQGAPFRFGHDFEDPAPLPQWPPLVTRPLAVASATSVGELRDGDCLAFDAVDFNAGWQSAVLRFSSDAKEMNTDKSARTRPRHRAATDPVVLEATHNDGAQEKIRTQWSFVYNVDGDSWVRFNQVPLGSGYRRFRVVYGVDSAQPRRVEVRLDSVQGPLVGQVDLHQTDEPCKGRIQIYDEAIGRLSAEATGDRDVFFVFRSEDGRPVGEFEYFRFEQYRDQIALQKNEVKLELRVGSKDGPKIGEFYPRFTGDSNLYRQFVTPLERAQGTQPLLLVVRSDLSGPVGRIEGLKLQKAEAPASPNNVGLPPRLDSQGRMVLPQPTHRPSARPADKYYQQRLARRGPRPLFLATRLQTPPAMDGRLDEWLDNTRVMNLRESFDGSETTAPASAAWVGYDDRAMYIAAKHPVNDATAFRNRMRLSVPMDYMEVALQDPSATSSVLTLRGYPDGHYSCAEAGMERAVSFRVGLEADAWVCEWRIPFAACGFTPRETPQLAFNLAVRHREHDTWAVWRGTGGAPGEVSRAGTLLYPSEYAATSRFPKDGLAVWLDAADSTTLQQDDEGKIIVWKDKSEKANHARQSDPNHRPLYVANALNSKPALQFSETTATRLELADLSDDKISATIFVVFTNPTPGAEVNHNARLFTASDGQSYDYQVGLCASVPGMETGGPRQMMAGFQGVWARKVRVGCFSPTYQTYFTGHIAEILVYTRPLAPEEQQQVRAYLMSKWDL